MINNWLVIGIALVYLFLLFIIAEFAERHLKENKPRPWVYSLSLAIYCTSWAMFGTVAQSEKTGWYLAPTYLGTILLFVFAWPILEKIIRIAKQNKVTSIADFIAGRYGNSLFLGVLVVMICLVAIIPYISIQLKSIVNSYFIVTGNSFSTVANEIQTSYYSKKLSLDAILEVSIWQDTAFYIAIIVAIFTIFFGTRRVDATEHHQGIMLAIAFESMIKLTAFLAVGIFAVYFIFDGFADLWQQANSHNKTQSILSNRQPSFVYLSQAFLGMVAILCLPRQFHVLVVENRSISELKKSRWIFPGYLLLINLFILPIALAGNIYFQGGGVSAEDYILMLPITEGNHLLTLLVFVGGVSAATSMIIVATIVLSTMVSNEIIMPLAVKFNLLNLNLQADLSKKILHIRRWLIFIILFLSYAYYRKISVSEQLATTGLISMALIAQLAPALVTGIYWKRSSRKAIIIGLIAGLIVWAYTLLLPLLISSGYFSNDLLTQGLGGISLLKPQELFALYGFDSITHGLFWSLLVNISLLIYFSLKDEQSLTEKIHTSHFLSEQHNEISLNSKIKNSDASENKLRSKELISHTDLEILANRFLGKEASENAFNQYCKDNQLDNIQEANTIQLNRYIKTLLQSIIGSTSTRLIFESLANNRNVPFEDVFDMIDEAADVLLFNRELLQSAIENISQGISVVDKELNLVAWNSQYVQLFDYPESLIQVGRPIEDLVRFNAEKGRLGEGDIDTLVAKRLDFMVKGSPHIHERQGEDGIVLELRGNPMPGGGFVTSFIDITEFRNQEDQLKLINLKLEQRVSERTQELESLNGELLIAKNSADKANQSKTRFLAAASHDVLQPLNAASLFNATLYEKAIDEKQKEISLRVQQSLHSAEQLLKDLIDISKYDSNKIETDKTQFSIKNLMQQLSHEFEIIAKQKNIKFRSVYCDKTTYTDRTMLRRILQNLIANALKHSQGSKIVFGCKKEGDIVKIQVIDNGKGIAKDNQKSIFNEFVQLNSDKNAIEGHGLGLAIVNRIKNILKLPIQLNSEPNKGSVFSISVPLINTKPPYESAQIKNTDVIEKDDNEQLILCVDNEMDILDGMRTLLESWGYRNVLTSLDGNYFHRSIFQSKHDQHLFSLSSDQVSSVSLILVDYHLENNRTGIDVIKNLRKKAGWDIPCVVISADQSEPIRQEINNEEIFLLNKPIKPLSLRTLLNRLIKSRN